MAGFIIELKLPTDMRRMHIPELPAEYPSPEAMCRSLMDSQRDAFSATLVEASTGKCIFTIARRDSDPTKVTKEAIAPTAWERLDEGDL